VRIADLPQAVGAVISIAQQQENRRDGTARPGILLASRRM
jgi:hypothetical protein